MYRMILLALCLFAIPAVAQDSPLFPEPTQNPDANYRVFRTKNIHMMLKLNTRTGQIWELQWSFDDNNRFTAPINTAVLVPVGTTEHPIVVKPGRFTLTPTENIYTFVLLDQEDGRTWQIQWGDAAHRQIVAIP
jgi:hypothetical protein